MMGIPLCYHVPGELGSPSPSILPWHIVPCSPLPSPACLHVVHGSVNAPSILAASLLLLSQPQPRLLVTPRS